jgi:hypothetical protein
MSTFDQKTTGLGAVESLQRDLARTRTIDVSVTCKASPGRSAGDNVIILRDQAKKGRNVIFLDKKEQEAGTRLWKASIADITSDRATFRPMVRGGTKVGDLMVDSIRTHVQQRRRERGTVKPVTPRVAREKAFETGRKNLPPLYRTGKLMGSLYPVVKELK